MFHENVALLTNKAMAGSTEGEFTLFYPSNAQITESMLYLRHTICYQPSILLIVL
jgi:hypothetical protein